jgi:hypothetical protein
VTLHDRLRATTIGDVVRLTPDEARKFRRYRGLCVPPERARVESLPEYAEQAADDPEPEPLYFELEWRSDGSADAKRAS